MYIIKYFLPALFIILIQSCSEPEGPAIPVVPLENNFSYPLQIGNEWTVSSSTIYTNIRPDSIKHLLTTYYTADKITVTKDTLLNSLQCYEMQEESENHFYTRAYYANTDSGFIKYAYSNGPGQILPKGSSGLRYLFNENYYNSITELINTHLEILDQFKLANDTLNYFDPPRVIYQYPLDVGKEWLFSSQFIRIDKEVIGKEIVYTNAGGFECYKIQWKYDRNLDGVTDDDLIYYEYVSSKGIIKSVINIKDVIISTTPFPYGVGIADVKVERVLTAINF